MRFYGMWRKPVKVFPVMLFWFFALSCQALAAEKPEYIDLGTVYVDEKMGAVNFKKGDIIREKRIDQPRLSGTAEGLFENIAGIDLKRISPAGDTGRGVILRGFDESRYKVLLDGRPINGSGVFGGEYVDWSAITTEDIERVEIIRGITTAQYGDTLGGIINIVPKKGREKMKIDIRSSYGSFNTVDAAVVHSGNITKDVYDNLSYGYWRTDGYLRNNFVDRHNFSGRLEMLMPRDMILELGMIYTLQKRGFVVENKKDRSNYDSDYPESDEDIGGGPRIHWWGRPGPFGPVRASKYWGDGSYWINRRGQYDVKLEKSFDSFDLKAQGYLNRQERTEYYYAIDDENKLVLERYTEPERSGGWLLDISMPAEDYSVVYGAEGVYLGYGKQQIKHADSSYFRIQPASYDEPEKASRRHAIFAQGEWDITDSLYVDMGLRYDNYWAKPIDVLYVQGLSPTFGVTYQIREGLEATAHFGQAYRFPTSPESYWFFAGYQPTGRKDLSPERALQGEAGLSVNIPDKAKFEVRGYYYDVEDYIRTIFGYKPSRVVYNIDKVILWGIEAEARYCLAAGLDLFANYTFQSTKKEGDILDESSELSDSLTELPDNKVNAGITYSFRAFTGEFVMRYVDKRSVIIGDLTKSGASELADLEQFATFDLNLTYKILENDNVTGKVGIAVENIFDASYEEREGFPMLGRMITGRISLTF
ncbi:MAG: TonB-dependent receptor plug domain-containing protein [Candidatus Omnitrophica bacterium]|nr:TonB-dependent receptor plug domain-containing protein [Candidatus Omnitrophota bacterium]